ncbi:MAG TPA: SpoIIE family protein phosphatase, partial [Rhodothermales bacterium]|nr:SpoIIE family protein phosphatase [Rhodothermales bacterium]
MEFRHLNPFTLRFASAPTEEAFGDYYVERYIRVARLGMLLGCIQYALFGLLDSAMVPGSLHMVRAIRLVVCLFVFGVFLFSYAGAFVRRMQIYVTLVPLVAGVGVLAMILAAEHVNSYYDFYAGIMLILFYVHALLRLRFVYAAAVSWALVLGYVFLSVVVVPTPAPFLANNVAFLLSANLSGMVASYALEYYTRHVFWQTRALNEKQQQLESEHARKSRELELTRQLQLSLLPARVPEHPAVDFAVYMKTATEIGGDYYDFDVADDGTLTFAIGDATGHGARAGAMVTATKILFASLRDEPDVLDILRKATSSLKRVGFARLYMAFAVGRLKDDRLELAGAGMPPALIYRAGKACVEEISLRGMPLGSFIDFPYQKVDVHLEPGDTLLLMSDGFAELFDAEGRMLGYDRAASALMEAGRSTPAEVVEHLKAAASDWVGDPVSDASRRREDDVTFLVMQMKA